MIIESEPLQAVRIGRNDWFFASVSEPVSEPEAIATGSALDKRNDGRFRSDGIRLWHRPKSSRRLPSDQIQALNQRRSGRYRFRFGYRLASAREGLFNPSSPRQPVDQDRSALDQHGH